MTSFLLVRLQFAPFTLTIVTPYHTCKSLTSAFVCLLKYLKTKGWVVPSLAFSRKVFVAPEAFQALWPLSHVSHFPFISPPPPPPPYPPFPYSSLSVCLPACLSASASLSLSLSGSLSGIGLDIPEILLTGR